MADPYLTKAQAVTRLEAYDIATESAALITDPDLRMASDELDDSKGPFRGERPYDQERQFPRVDPDTGDPEATVPEAVFDWVALRAYQIAIDEAPAVKSEGAGRVSVSYFAPKVPQIERRMCALIKPLQRKTGSFGWRARKYPPRGEEWTPGN